MEFKIHLFWILVFIFRLQTALCSTGPNDINASEDNLQTLFVKFMNKVKEILQGNDPYNYNGASGQSDTYGLYYNCSVSELIISGISAMNVTYLNVTQIDPNLYLEIDLTLQNIMVTGNYFLDVDTLTLLKLYGSGELGTRASFIGINITASVTQDVTQNNVLQFTDLVIGLGVPELKLDVKNLLNRPALSTFASQILTDISPRLLSEDSKLLGTLSSWAKSNLNAQTMKNEITLAFVIEFMQKFTQ